MRNRSDKLLIVEDDPGLQRQLRWCFDACEVLVAADRVAAVELIERHHPPVVTLDLGLPPDPANASEGLAALEEILRIAPHTKVIVVTGNDDRENALRAVELGAYDFYQKPVEAEVLGLIVQRALHLAGLEAENRELARNRGASPLVGIVASSPEMLKVCATVEKVAATQVSVLLLGESGTGKELLARALHDLSERSSGPFVAINCAAIPENLLESELFGYEKGAFTGAARQTRGKIEYASGGTLFLDEVGDLPPPLQAKLLRFLQERVIERIGGRETIDVDVRVVCATHQDLKAAIGEARFREDLYYRISEIVVRIPPLREREGDIPVLARALIERLARELALPARGLSDTAIAAMSRHGWPGNVREMENRLKRALIMSEAARIGADDLELEYAPVVEETLDLREVRGRAECAAVVRALALANNNLTHAADLLGITRPTLYALLNKFQIKH